MSLVNIKYGFVTMVAWVINMFGEVVGALIGHGFDSRVQTNILI
jgi:hypothetical protein